MLVSNPDNSNERVKFFKNGNSYAFRLSKQDREFLKIISPDGKEVTFRKNRKTKSNISEIADDIFDEHSDLMKRLESL